MPVNPAVAYIMGFLSPLAIIGAYALIGAIGANMRRRERRAKAKEEGK